MKKTTLKNRLLFVLILTMVSSTYAYADAPKVVVIPLSADLPSGVLSERETIIGNTKSVVSGGSSSTPVNCTPGKVILSGGFSQTSSSGVPILANENLILVNSYPLPNGTSWRVYVRNEQASTKYFRAYAVCARES